MASNICPALICGTTRDVYLQALEYDSTGRGMSGQEAGAYTRPLFGST